MFGQKDIWNKISLEELVVLLVQADSVLPPELLRLVHRTPLETTRLELRAVLVEGAKKKKYHRQTERRGERVRSHTQHESHGADLPFAVRIE